MEGPDALMRLREGPEGRGAGRQAGKSRLYMSPGGYSQGFVPEGW